MATELKFRLSSMHVSEEAQWARYSNAKGQVLYLEREAAELGEQIEVTVRKAESLEDFKVRRIQELSNLSINGLVVREVLKLAAKAEKEYHDDN